MGGIKKGEGATLAFLVCASFSWPRFDDGFIVHGGLHGTEHIT